MWSLTNELFKELWVNLLNFPISLSYTGLCKTIYKLAKKKDCEEVGEWRQSTSNHMYWCAASTPDGNCQVIKEKWKMFLLHIQNIHVNMERVTCTLEGDAADQLWLQPGIVMAISI